MSIVRCKVCGRRTRDGGEPHCLPPPATPVLRLAPGSYRLLRDVRHSVDYRRARLVWMCGEFKQGDEFVVQADRSLAKVAGGLSVPTENAIHQLLAPHLQRCCPACRSAVKSGTICQCGGMAAPEEEGRT